MRNTFQIHIKAGHKQTMYLIIKEKPFYGDLLNKMVATSSNHSTILAIHEAGHGYIWLRSMIQHIQESCGLSSIKDNPTTLFKDNFLYISQIK